MHQRSKPEEEDRDSPDLLTALIRTGAQKLIAQALKAEVADLLATFADQRDKQGHASWRGQVTCFIICREVWGFHYGLSCSHRISPGDLARDESWTTASADRSSPRLLSSLAGAPPFPLAISWVIRHVMKHAT